MHYIQIDNNLWCVFCPKTLEISVCDNKKRFEQIKRENANTHYTSNHCVKEIPINLHRIFIGVSEMCNMSCEYCYASSGTYGHKGRIMSPQNAIEFLENYGSQFASPLRVVFFGGEPLLAQDTMQAIISHYKELNSDVSYAIITNGTLLNESVIDFIKGNNISVTISMDGPKLFHDHYRKFKDGTGSFDCIAANIKAVKKAGIRVTAEATCGPNFFESYVPDTYSEFRRVFEEIGFDDLHVGIVVKPDGYGCKAAEGIQSFFSDMVDDAFDQLLQENVEHVLIARCFTETLLCLIKRVPISRCGAGVSNAYISAYGDLYSCHLFHAAHADKLNNDDYSLPSTIKVKTIDEVSNCADCFCKKVCLAWCPGISASMGRSEHCVIVERCIAQKSYTTQILKRFSMIYLNTDKWNLFSKNWRAFLTKKRPL